MIPRELLGTAQIPGETGELKLYRHNRDFVFSVAGVELMSSRVHGSEEELAELALASVPDTDSAHVLVGGLGMGYTLARVLDLVGAKAKVEVVELVPEVLTWNREWLGGLCGNPLSDARVTVHEGDVAQKIRAAAATFDAILLDVDNGPEGLMRSANDWLYNHRGLVAAGKAMRSNGVLAIWSSAHFPWFTHRIQRAGFRVREERVLARRTKGARRTIWLAKRAKRE